MIQMRKIGLILLITLAVLCGLGVLAFSFAENWVNKNLPVILNSNPERRYDVLFEKVQFDFFKRVILIEDVKIRPFGDQVGTVARAEVYQAFLSQIDPMKLFFKKDLSIGDLMFLEPHFRVYFSSDSVGQDQAGDALQGLFGDLLSRGQISNFQVGRANAEFFREDSLIGSISDLNIIATDLITDSIKLSNPIPFDYGRVRIALDRLQYRMDNGQNLDVGEVKFDTQKSEIKILGGFSMKYREEVQKLAKSLPYQQDLVEVEMDSLIFSGLEANTNLYSDLDVRSQKLQVFGLDLRDFRDKSRPRAPEPVKPMFQGLIQQINFPIRLDTLELIEGKITYGETVPNSGAQWDIHFDQLNGIITKLTTIPEFQRQYGMVEAKFEGKLEGQSKINFQLTVPFDEDVFKLKAELSRFNLTGLNAILKPVMNGDIVDGRLDRLKLELVATATGADATLYFDYADLKVELFKKGTQKRSRLKSALANLVINTSNLPGDKNYNIPSYRVVRDQHRGPFHLIWNSTKEGIMQVVPSGVAQGLLKPSEK